MLNIGVGDRGGVGKGGCHPHLIYISSYLLFLLQIVSLYDLLK